jgi:phosphatidylinositol-3-phosphatase
VIVMENTSFGQIIGPDGSSEARNAPYMNGTLKKKCGLATNFHSITHPSLPNYIAMTAGTLGGIVTNCNDCSTNVPSVFSQLKRNGRQWRVYAESMPEPCYHHNSGLYVKRHNPAPYFTKIAGDCKRWNLPMGGSNGAFAKALRNDRLRAYTVVVPNLCNDMHDCEISVGDAWLRRWVPRIAATRSYRQGRTALFITFDEGAGRGWEPQKDCLADLEAPSCHIATFVLSAHTRPGTRSAKLYTLYSLLRTTQSLLDMPRFFGKAATASGMRRAFGLRGG